MDSPTKFSIRDYGNKVDVTINDVLVSSFTASSEDFGGHIAIASQWSDHGALKVDNIQVTAIPEPSTYALFGLGALALVIAYRRKVA